RLRQDRETSAAVRTGQRPRERAERTAYDGSLDAIQQQRIVDDADSAAHIRERVTGERAPGERRRDETEGGPRVDGDRSVAQLGDRPFEAVTQRSLRRWIDEHVRTERALQFVVRMGD